MADAYAQTRKTYDRVASEWASFTLKHAVRDRGNVQAVDFLKACERHGSVLDVGCGTGRFSSYFASKGMRVVGIDFSGGQLAEARKIAPKARFIRMDMRSLKFGGGSFDGIWSAYSLHHVTRKDAAITLHEFHRVLKPAGIASVLVWYGNGSELRKDKTGTRLFVMYTLPGLRKALTSAGFSVLKTYKWKDEYGYQKVGALARKV